MTRNSILKWSALGLSLTSFNSYRNWYIFPNYLKAFGFFVGLVGGGIFGIIRSTEYTLYVNFSFK
jgi:hypothetical protein